MEGSDAWAERALILKAIAARQARVLPAGSGTAMDEVTGFAETIRGNERSELIRTTTLTDVQDANTSTVNPNDISANNDANGDNDGLFQRFDDSCGPTSGQILHGEIDPVFARQVHDEGINNADPTSTHAQQQSTVLNNGGGVAVSRLGTQASGDLTSMMDTAEAAGTLTAGQRAGIVKLVAGQALTPDEQAAADSGIQVLRAANGGHPTTTEVAAMQSNNGLAGAGMSIGGAIRAASPDTYTTNNSGGNNAGGAAVLSNADLNSIETALIDGQDVGIRIGYTAGGGHGMTATDTRTDADGNRTFLVADPWSGATRWVSDTDLASGAFTATFGIGAATITHFYTES